MNAEEGLEFLREHQPMPDDSELDTATIRRYDEVRKYFLANPDAQCVPLFINSFGFIDGFGVYQLVEDVLLKFPRSEIVPHLVAGISSDRHPVRYWSAQMAGSFTDDVLMAPLANLMETDDDFDIRDSAVRSLALIGGVGARELLEKQLAREEDSELKDVIEEVLNDLQ